MVVTLVTHDVRFGKNFPRNLFCDARLTKDGVTLIPVHKIILSGFSSKFKKIFESEDEGGGLTVVPVVDFPNLKRVVNFIYDGQVTLHGEEELSDFLDALVLLKVEVEHTVITMENTGKRELRVVDVKHMGMRLDEATDQESAGRENIMQNSSQDIEALRQEALCTLDKDERSWGCGIKLDRQRKTRGRSGVRQGRSSSSRDRGRKRRSDGLGSNAGEDEGSGNAKRKRSSWGEESIEERNGRKKSKRERESTSSDFSYKKVRCQKNEETRDQNTLDEGDRRSKVKTNTRICFFYQEGTCIKGDFCTYSHDIVSEREQLERHRDAAERKEDPGTEVLYLRDKTFTVKTLDIEEHFSKFGDVVKVKFIGKQSRGNLFKVVVVSASGARKAGNEGKLRKLSCVNICGVELKVESGDRDSTMWQSEASRSPIRQSPISGRLGSMIGEERMWDGSLGKRRSRIELWTKSRQASEASKVNSKGATPSGRGGAKVDKEVLRQKEQQYSKQNTLAVTPSWSPFGGQTSHFEPHFLERLPAFQDYALSRDLLSEDQDLPSTLSESSVDSFLKGVRSQVEMSKVEKEVENGKKEVEEDIKEVGKSDKELEKGNNEVETDIKEVDGGRKEVVKEVLPSKELNEDTVRVKMESMGGVATVKGGDQDFVKEIIQDLVKIATHFKEDLVQMEL